MAQIRVMHYINQFFVGIGGEEKADVPVGVCEGSMGPGKRLQNLLGESAKIVVTTYCGDNYFSEHTDESIESILKIAQKYKMNLSEFLRINDLSPRSTIFPGQVLLVKAE